MITEDELDELQSRKNVEVYKKYRYIEEKSNLFNAKMKEEYSYYICDYCHKEIKIEKKWEERTGGTVQFNSSITGGKKLQLALHNQCLKQMQKEIDNLRERRRSGK